MIYGKINTKKEQLESEDRRERKTETTEERGKKDVMPGSTDSAMDQAT